MRRLERGAGNQVSTEGKQRDQLVGRFALTGGRVVLPDAIENDKAVVIEGGTIAAIVDAGALDTGIERVDVAGRYVAPGLIDIHTHGALGHTFNEPTEQAFAAITEANARYGVTSLLATLVTAAIPELVACLEFSRRWMQAPRAGARVLGVHVEGPYINTEQKGAHDPEHIRNPDDGSVEFLLVHRDVIAMLTYAPELPGALELTTTLSDLGIVPAGGHSSAQDADVKVAMQLGLRHMVHLWSGQSSTVREGPWRKPGILEASLVFEGLTGEIISDNRHLPPTLMRLAYKCLGPDRLCVISDATSGAGLPQGSRFRMGSMEYEVDDGVGMTFDRTSFAGSTALMGQMIPILVEVVGIPLVETFRMATLTPARVIGVDGDKGSLEAGKDADIAIFDENLAVWATMIAGQWAWTWTA